MKTALLKGFIIFHLAMIVLAVTHQNERLNHKFLYPLRLAYTYYYRITYNNQKFAFFAPSVAKQLSSKIICTDKDGKQFEFSYPVPNGEIALRSKKIPNHFRYDKRKEPLLKSMKEYVKAHHPNVKKIDVLIFENDIPTMAQYRKGAKKSAKLFYKTTISV